MSASQFEVLLKEFENFFGCPLHADRRNSCLIKLESGLSIQLEMGKRSTFLVGCRLSLPQDTLWHTYVLHALKANNTLMPQTGVFGYSKQWHALIHFMQFPTDQIVPHLVLARTPPFIERSLTWHTAIAARTLPPLPSEPSGEASPMNLFTKKKS